MKQIVQNLRSGETEVLDVSAPKVDRGTLLIATTCSLISSGTERMLVEFGRSGVLEKIRQQPDKVRMVLEKLRTDGLLATIDAVRSKLDLPLPMGYCNLGRVLEVGEGVTGFAVGDRVVSNGPHAEVVRVPARLCARVPEGVLDEDAVFTVLGSIALQGIRLAAPTLGEVFAVSGLGLIGLLAVQLLKANGCRVVALDFDEQRLCLAESFGASPIKLGESDPVATALGLTAGRGVDGVLVTAATRSSEPIHQAARMCRKRGRIVLVGVTGLELSRADFYEKELTFQVSCSYGPGRYDPDYEEGGHDYPLAFVRWTEQRNFEAVLQLMAAGRLHAQCLISRRFALDQATEAYRALVEEPALLGLLLTYPGVQAEVAPTRAVRAEQSVRTTPPAESLRAAVIGAGNYAARVLIPALQRGGIELHTLCTRGSVQGAHCARKFGFRRQISDSAEIFDNVDCNLVVIATRHDSHASLAIRALRSGKHVFVEKPLALTHSEIDAVEQALDEAARTSPPPMLTVGFNRRFAPQAQLLRRLLATRSVPCTMTYTVNAGAIPADHWIHDPAVGGGRLIGEACHFIDLLRFLAGCKITSSTARAMRSPDASAPVDSVAIVLTFQDGSLGTIQYFANGPRNLPKERLEVFAAGAALQLDNFRALRGYRWRGFRNDRRWRMDKGQDAMVAEFAAALRGGGGPIIPAAEIFEVARVSVDCALQVARL